MFPSPVILSKGLGRSLVRRDTSDVYVAKQQCVQLALNVVLPLLAPVSVTLKVFLGKVVVNQSKHIPRLGDELPFR